MTARARAAGADRRATPPGPPRGAAGTSGSAAARRAREDRGVGRAFVSSAIACSLARYRGARSSRSKSRKATTSARSTRWSTASVPTYTPASGGGSWSPPVTATTGRPAAASSSSRSRVTPGRRLANPDPPHSRHTGGRSAPHRAQWNADSSDRLDRRVAPLAPGERATGPARQHASPPRRVVHADDLRVGPAQLADQRRRQERRLPRLLVRAVDDVDDRPAGTLGAHREAHGHIAERRHARDARARRRGEQRDAGPPGPFDEHVAGVPRRRPLLLQRLVVLVDHDHHRELGARRPGRGPSPDDDIDAGSGARPLVRHERGPHTAAPQRRRHRLGPRRGRHHDERRTTCRSGHDRVDRRRGRRQQQHAATVGEHVAGALADHGRWSARSAGPAPGRSLRTRSRQGSRSRGTAATGLLPSARTPSVRGRRDPRPGPSTRASTIGCSFDAFDATVAGVEGGRPSRGRCDRGAERERSRRPPGGRRDRQGSGSRTPCRAR